VLSRAACTMASAAEERAQALIAKAEKKLNGMFSFGNGKFEEAAEYYAQAAKQYQLAKSCAQPSPPFPLVSPQAMYGHIPRWLL
jgi:hypothetical protein